MPLHDVVHAVAGSCTVRFPGNPTAKVRHFSENKEYFWLNNIKTKHFFHITFIIEKNLDILKKICTFAYVKQIKISNMDAEFRINEIINECFTKLGEVFDEAGLELEQEMQDYVEEMVNNKYNSLLEDHEYEKTLNKN